MPLVVEHIVVDHDVSGTNREVYKPKNVVMCPKCLEKMYYYDMRKRYFIKDGNELICIYVCRYRHEKCGKIYTILPDFAIPYRRHVVGTYQQAIDSEVSADYSEAPADGSKASGWYVRPEPPPIESSTIRRIRRWFWSQRSQILKTIRSIRANDNKPDEVKTLNDLRRGPHWLAKLVREVFNRGFILPPTSPRLPLAA